MSESGKAIFLSYAHEDAVVVRRIAEALRGFGCEVWFDEHELRGGDSWDAKIRQQIRECALFLSVISAQTNERKEGYFRREWKLAVDRTHDMADGVPYLLPVVIDDTTDGAALVPAVFREVQWLRLPHGLPGPEFVDAVKRLLDGEPERAVTRSAPIRKPSATSVTGPSGLSWKMVLPVVAVLVVGLIWALIRPAPQANSVAPDIAPVATETAAQAVDELNDLSIAVMPLVNMSSNAENAYFAGGIHEDVMTNLTRVRGLEVVSRTTVLRVAADALTLPEIGNRLKVRYIVEGSVRRIGNHVRVTVQLIDAREDRHLWASNFERELVDVFATQSELAKEISNSLHLEIQPETVGKLINMPTHSVLAYDLYNKSMSLQKTEDTTKESMLRQIELLEQAVEEDPDFVEAWGVLKRRYDYMSNRLGSLDWMIGTSEDRDAGQTNYRTKSDRALAKAVALDPDNVETLLSLAVNHIWPQPERVLREQKVLFDRILAEHPDNAMGWYHLAWWFRHQVPEDDENAFVAFEKALKHDPFNARIVRAVLERYRQLGNRDDVARMAERLTQIIPEVAEDPSLRKIPGWRRFDNLITAFQASADPAVVADMRRLVEDPDTLWDYSASLVELTWGSWYLQNVENNWEGAMAIASRRGELDRVSGEGSVQVWLKIVVSFMMHQWRQGDEESARESAHRIQALAQKEWFQERTYSSSASYISSLAASYFVLGEAGKLQDLTEFMVAEGSRDGFDDFGLDTITTLSLSDVDRALDLIFKQIDRQPNWRGTDMLAIWCRNWPGIVAHPRMQAFYIQQNKWLPYLADRLPEYAEATKE